MVADCWREFDLAPRKRKLENAFRHGEVNDAKDVPVIISTGNYFGFGGVPRPKEYWEEPAVMLRVQSEFMARHLRGVRDDMVPYFMPWFGTGVLASAFGCEVKPATGVGDDPAVLGHIVHTPAQAAALAIPDFTCDGLCPKVLRFMTYALENGDLPVALTDLNSPLSTLAQVIGYENLFVWMYDEPAMIHELMAMFTDAFIAWVKLQKQLTGEPINAANALQGVWSPEGTGVWISDDDLVSINAELYSEFVVPQYKRLFSVFGGGSLHYCGEATRHLKNFNDIGKLTVINNSPMGDENAFAELAAGRPAGTMLQIQDNAPADPESYYDNLFSRINNFRGIMVASWALDNVAMGSDGGYENVERSAEAAANQVVDAVRAAIAKRIGVEAS